MARRPQYHVCSNPQCPELVSRDEPCPKHGRPRNAPWSTDRDRAKQHHFRNAVLNRDGNRCVRCGTTDNLVAHHVKPGYDVEAGVTLCELHHREVDANAR